MPEREQNRFVTALILTATFAILGALGIGLWRVLASLGSAPAAAVITASATVLISVFSLIYSQRTEHRVSIEEAQREYKRGVYEEFISFWFKALMAPVLGDQRPSQHPHRRHPRPGSRCAGLRRCPPA